jgi:CubicO group peptidase (beta-lactamase class C family)
MPFNVLVGNGETTCCTEELGLGASTAVPIASASKMMAIYTVLGMVEKGMLTLEDKLSKWIPWWTATDARSGVKVKHLMAQTDGLPMFPFFVCLESNSDKCAQQAYNMAGRRTPGTHMEYGETSFHVLAAVALRVSGKRVFNEVFREYLANPLGMSSSCHYVATINGHFFPDSQDPGGDLKCSSRDYAKLLIKIAANKVPTVSKDLVRGAESAHTMNIPVTFPMGIPVGDRIEYGQGEWRHCQTSACAYDETVMVQSMGFFGFVPYVYRSNGQAMWVIIGKVGIPGMAMLESVRIGLGIRPVTTPFNMDNVPAFTSSMMTKVANMIIQKFKDAVKAIAKLVAAAVIAAAKALAEKAAKTAKAAVDLAKKIAAAAAKKAAEIAKAIADKAAKKGRRDC